MNVGHHIASRFAMIDEQLLSVLLRLKPECVLAQKHSCGVRDASLTIGLTLFSHRYTWHACELAVAELRASLVAEPAPWEPTEEQKTLDAEDKWKAETQWVFRQHNARLQALAGRIYSL